MADDCNEVLKHGVLDQVLINSNLQIAKTFNEWIYDADFSTHDQALAAGLSAGVVVYGVPLEVGGTFTDQQKDTWKHDHLEFQNNTLNLSQKYSLVFNQIDANVVQAWSACMNAKQAGTAPLWAWLTSPAPDLAMLHLTWVPVAGDTGSSPVVLSSDIVGGTRISGQSIAFTPQQSLLSGLAGNQILINRIHGTALVIIVQTSRGDVSATLPAIVDPPVVTQFSVSPSTIRLGQSATLTWASHGSTQVTIDNGIGTRTPNGAQTVIPSSVGNFTYTLIATNSGGQSQQSTLPLSVLENAIIIVSGLFKFHTGCDDKDDDNHVGIRFTLDDGTVLHENGDLPPKQPQDDDPTWHDDTDNPQDHYFFVPFTNSAIDTSIHRTITVTVWKSGDAHWHFGYTFIVVDTAGNQYVIGNMGSNDTNFGGDNNSGSWTYQLPRRQ